MVISRRRLELPENVRLARGVAAAIALARSAGDSEAFLAGGGEIYRQALAEDRVDRVYLTRVHHTFEGDAAFPELDPAAWRLAERQDCAADEKNPYAFSYLTYEPPALSAPRRSGIVRWSKRRDAP